MSNKVRRALCKTASRLASGENDRPVISSPSTSGMNGNGWPVPAGDHQRWEHLLARAIHWLLIIGTVLMPISGFLMSSLGGHGVAVFGFELVPPNPDPANPDKVVAHNEMLAGLSHQVHGAAGVTMIVALLLHVAGALKHHVIDKDGTLRRMLGARISG